MLKVLLIVILISYVLSRIGRIFVWKRTSSSHKKSKFHHESKKKNLTAQGGEYIDFEEVD